jgi:large subunit ribosomal protein L21
MYAIVDIAGQQFKVQKDQKIFVHRLEAEEGTEMSFDKILLVDNEGIVTIGAPTVENAKITATVLDHVKGDKVIIFKKRRRKGYKLKRGHRQQFTQIQIGEILA